MEYKPLDYQMDNSNGLVGSSVNYFKGLSKKVIGAVTVAGIAGIVAVGVLSSGGSNSPITGTNPVVVDTPTPYSTIENIITPTPLATNTPVPTPTPDLEKQYYDIGRNGDDLQVYESTKAIIEYAKNTGNREEAAKQFRNLVVGIADDGFELDKIVEFRIACYEHRENKTATSKTRDDFREVNFNRLEREKDDPKHLRVESWSYFPNCFN
jgi:hypothetical protein